MAFAAVLLVVLSAISFATASEPDDIVGQYEIISDANFKGEKYDVTITKKGNEVYTWTDDYASCASLTYSGVEETWTSIYGSSGVFGSRALVYSIGCDCKLFEYGYQSVKLIDNSVMVLEGTSEKFEYKKMSDMKCETEIRQCGRKKRSVELDSEPLSDNLTTEVQGVDYIFGGLEASPNKFPFMAKLAGCGGSIISESWILTAAHCISDGAFYVKVGAHDVSAIETNRMNILVERKNVIIHENYDDKNKSQYDIALIKLPEPLKFNKYIQPICLPQKGDTLSVGALTSAMGWGLTSSFGWLSDVLMEVDKLPIKECDISVSGIVCINPKNGKGVCQGDSGGVLAQKTGPQEYIQYGVTSFYYTLHGEDKGCQNAYEQAFTSTEYYLDWIIKHTSKC